MSNEPAESTGEDRGAIVDELRWKKFGVLDDGFVCLVDVMGDDGSVVRPPGSVTVPAPARSPTIAP